jgi:hypothetical protein
MMTTATRPTKYLDPIFETYSIEMDTDNFEAITAAPRAANGGFPCVR